MNIYHLMNKEKPLLAFYITEEYGEKTARQDACFVESSQLPVGFSDIHDWINRWNLAKHKEYLRRWLKEWQIDDLERFIHITHGLSLNLNYSRRHNKDHSLSPD